MFPSKLIEVLKDAIPNKERLIIEGPPGVGKTSIIRQVCESLKCGLIVSHPAVEDPTDQKGLPFKSADETHARFLPFGALYQAINAQDVTVWFLDDFGQGSDTVQKGYMQLIMGGLSEHKLKDNIVFILATNDVTHRAGVSGLLEPIKSRCTILHLEPSLDDFCTWALNNGIPVELVAFLRSRPELLFHFEPTKAIVNQPCPRTWEIVGRRLARNIVDFDLVAGAVGKGAATDFLAFLKLAKDAPSLDEIIMNPKTAPLPVEPSIKYLVTTGLARRADVKNFARIYEYLDRLPQPFRVLCLKEATKINKELLGTETFIRWSCGEATELK